MEHCPPGEANRFLVSQEIPSQVSNTYTYPNSKHNNNNNIIIIIIIDI